MNLQTLIDQARHPDAGRRRTAMRDLVRHPSQDVINVLVVGLTDAGSVADAAMHSLLEIGGEAVARAVVALLGHAEIRPRSMALDVLIALETAAGPVLVELLEHPDRELRKMAAEVLARGEYRVAGPPLLRRVADPDPVVRAAVAGALAALGSADAADALLDQFQAEPEVWVRYAIAAAIPRIGTAQTVWSLLQMVTEEPIVELIRAEASWRSDLEAVVEGEAV